MPLILVDLAGGDFHYMSNDGYIHSTNSPIALAPNLREIITLP